MCCLVGTAHHRCDPTPYAHIAGRGGSFRIDRGYGWGWPPDRSDCALCLIDIARNGKHKDQLKAAIKLAELTGYTSEQRIVVEHINHDMKGQLARIKNMAQQLGLDARQLIAQAGITDPDVIDAEFTEVEVGTSGITDDTSE
jgi:hypothetical protein